MVVYWHRSCVDTTHEITHLGNDYQKYCKTIKTIILSNLVLAIDVLVQKTRRENKMTSNPNKILVIDDESTICDLVRVVGSQMGFEVSATSDADEFRRLYASLSPSVVILDLQMPEVDGIEIMRYLASVRCTARTLLVSGMDLKTLAAAENLGKSRGLDMCTAQQKPVRLAALKKILRESSRNHQHVCADELRHAIRSGQLEVHYQPIASHDAEGGWVIDGAEALVRWQHPEYGQIMPARFVKLAEESGLIVPLTDFVLHEVIEQHAQWRMQGHECTISINMSATLFKDVEYPNYIEALFAGYGARASDFIFEITESATTNDIALTTDVLTRLRLKGFELSIDDFGTGYSSLKQLFLLPFNILKIDLSFVSRMLESEDARKMVKVMVYLAEELGMTSCAEGVEDDATMGLLEELGCDKIQGYKISRAVPGPEFLQVTEAWNGPHGDHQAVISQFAISSPPGACQRH